MRHVYICFIPLRFELKIHQVITCDNWQLSPWSSEQDPACPRFASGGINSQLADRACA